jgi:hypothetical protein
MAGSRLKAISTLVLLESMRHEALALILRFFSFALSRGGGSLRFNDSFLWSHFCRFITFRRFLNTEKEENDFNKNITKQERE